MQFFLISVGGVWAVSLQDSKISGKNKKSKSSIRKQTKSLWNIDSQFTYLVLKRNTEYLTSVLTTLIVLDRLSKGSRKFQAKSEY